MIVHNVLLKEMNTDAKRDLGVYIHIPFCAKKCDYCDFLSGPSSKEVIEEYFEALYLEIEQYSDYSELYTISTIFIGGGTPSVVDSSYIEGIMEKLMRVFHIDQTRLEATIEINPGTVSREKLLAYKRAGINRISFGLQSTNNEELKLLGRIHTYEQFEQNYHLARELGFLNINIDLMSALPGQTLENWTETLNKVIQLSPEHISAYSLIIEEGTKFYERYQEGSPGSKLLPNEETDRFMYSQTKSILKENGYLRYEISNYAKQGFECKHNVSYWIGTEYLGIGLGASSYIGGARFSNIDEVEEYIQLCKQSNNSKIELMDIRREYTELTKEEKMEEFMFLGLRICDGISKKEFSRRFITPIEEIYGSIIQELKLKKLIEEEGDNIKLTEYGLDISNYVLAEFLL